MPMWRERQSGCGFSVAVAETAQRERRHAPRGAEAGRDPSDLSSVHADAVALPRLTDGGLARWIGLVAAIAAHAAVLAAFALMGPPEPSGGGGQWLEAISVEVVLAQAVEARDTQQPDSTTAASGTIAPDDGDPTQDPVRQEAAKPNVEESTEQPDKLKTEAERTEEMMPPEAKPQSRIVKQSENGEED